MSCFTKGLLKLIFHFSTLLHSIPVGCIGFLSAFLGRCCRNGFNDAWLCEYWVRNCSTFQGQRWFSQDWRSHRSAQTLSPISRSQLREWTNQPPSSSVDFWWARFCWLGYWKSLFIWTPIFSPEKKENSIFLVLDDENKTRLRRVQLKRDAVRKGLSHFNQSLNDFFFFTYLVVWILESFLRFKVY